MAQRSAADYLVSWVVGEVPRSLAVRSSLHTSGSLCQALMYSVKMEGVEEREKTRSETASLSDPTQWQLETPVWELKRVVISAWCCLIQMSN